MNIEIERKFLVESFDTSIASKNIKIKQGYISSGNGRVVRVRTFNDKAYITIKYRKTKLARGEFEYEIPYADALDLINNACDNNVLDKVRYIYYFHAKKWEIDVFKGKNEGLILAEIELNSEDESFDIPDFIGKEVTHEPKYSNHNLAKR